MGEEQFTLRESCMFYIGFKISHLSILAITPFFYFMKNSKFCLLLWYVSPFVHLFSKLASSGSFDLYTQLKYT